MIRAQQLLDRPSSRSMCGVAQRRAAHRRQFITNAIAAPRTDLSQLQALRQMTTVVADTGDVRDIARFRTQDCTTNPTLVLRALQNADSQHLVHTVLHEARMDAHKARSGRPFADIADRLEVALGCEILKLISGRVSSEVDAHLAFDADATHAKALRLLELYAGKGVEPSKVYIKIATTWEGIRACERLEKEGVQCNMTLLFNMAQALACADAGATLISPFVGRIRDWYMQKQNREYSAAEVPHTLLRGGYKVFCVKVKFSWICKLLQDPGVVSVKRIYNLYKLMKVPTIVMAASFRTADEIRELAGCDYLTISPKLLEELDASTQPLLRKLQPGTTTPITISEARAFQDARSEAGFDKLLQADDMAMQLLYAGLKSFQADQDELEKGIAMTIQQQLTSN